MFVLEEREQQSRRNTLTSINKLACMTAKYGSRGLLRDRFGAEAYLDGQ